MGARWSRFFGASCSFSSVEQHSFCTRAKTFFRRIYRFLFMGGLRWLYWCRVDNCHNFMVWRVKNTLSFRFVSNRYLRKVTDQDVEWGYCFDVHLNAFFPLLMMLHVVLPLLFYGSFTKIFIFTRLGLIDYPGFLARILGNTIWFIASIYYVYITFLGYTGKKTMYII